MVDRHRWTAAAVRRRAALLLYGIADVLDVFATLLDPIRDEPPPRAASSVLNGTPRSTLRG